MNQGYFEVLARDHPRARKNGFIYLHILEAEKRIGRYLEEGEVVHHLNGIKTDNRLDNLIVFKTPGDHNSFHGGGTLIPTNEDGVYRCVHKKTNVCPQCGGRKTRDAEKCAICTRGLIDRDVVRNLYPVHGVKEIARMLNVSSMAIYKICKDNKWEHLGKKKICKSSITS